MTASDARLLAELFPEKLCWFRAAHGADLDRASKACSKCMSPTRWSGTNGETRQAWACLPSFLAFCQRFGAPTSRVASQWWRGALAPVPSCPVARSQWRHWIDPGTAVWNTQSRTTCPNSFGTHAHNTFVPDFRDVTSAKQDASVFFPKLDFREVTNTAHDAVVLFPKHAVARVVQPDSLHDSTTRGCARRPCMLAAVAHV